MSVKSSRLNLINYVKNCMLHLMVVAKPILGWTRNIFLSIMDFILLYTSFSKIMLKHDNREIGL